MSGPTLTDADWIKINADWEAFGGRMGVSHFIDICKERGWVMVPREPTPSIIAAGFHSRWVEPTDIAGQYRAMIAAAEMAAAEGEGS